MSIWKALVGLFLCWLALRAIGDAIGRAAAAAEKERARKKEHRRAWLDRIPPPGQPWPNTPPGRTSGRQSEEQAEADFLNDLRGLFEEERNNAGQEIRRNHPGRTD